MLAVDSELTISHVEIAGAARAAIDAGKGSHVRVVAADVRDNPGAAMAVRSGATAAVSHSVFTRNGTAGRDQKTVRAFTRSPCVRWNRTTRSAPSTGETRGKSPITGTERSYGRFSVTRNFDA